jgi:hypothetical protein
MRTLTVLLLMGLLCVGTVSSAATETEQEKAAIEAAALDYMAGAHEGNADRIERSVHPELTKRSVMKMSPDGREVLRTAGFSRLAELVRAGQVPLLEGGKDQVEFTLYAVREGLASGRVVSPVFYDYCHFANIDGQWKLMQVLWCRNPAAATEAEPKPAFDPEKEKKAIRQAALDYLEGFHSGDAERMARAIHPELCKIIPATLPQTGKTMLNYGGSELLIEATRARLGLLDEDKRNIRLTIFDVQPHIALVEVLSTMFYDYLQLACINGEWKIVNVIWKMNPDAPRPSR